MAKSIYLSEARFLDAVDRIPYARELKKIAESVQSGGQVDYDTKELDRIIKTRRLILAVPLRAVFGVLFRLFLPAFILILFLLFVPLFVDWATLITRWLRSP